MTSKEHAKLLGLLFWIYIAIQLAVTTFATIVVFVMSGAIISELSKIPRRPNEPNPEVFFSMLPMFMIFALIIVLVMMIPKLIAGYGLRKGKSWAKIWAIIACCVGLLSIPFGTAVGVYGLWFIFGDAGKEYFDNNYQSNQMPQPPPNNWQ
jgi:predicted benzoate:H+ symporter BenE